jgi:hypothetical protein
MINCKESAVRSSKLRDRRLKGIAKLELWYHIMICKLCRIYGKQINKMGRIARLIGDASCGLDDHSDEVSQLKLTDDAKTRMKKNLHS